MLILFPNASNAQYAVNFDGTDDLVSLPQDIIDLTSAYTVEAWIRPESFSIINTWRRRIFHQTGTNSLDFAVMDDQTLAFISSVGSVNGKSTATLSAGTWHHVALTFNGTATYTLYIDGKAEAPVAGGPGTSGGGTTSAIGAIAAGSAFFQGSIDEVRLWSDVRTTSEIQANMHKELVGNEANLLAYYDMANGSGTSLTDNSTNTNTGTLSGPLWKASGAHAGPRMALEFDGTDDEVSLTGPDLTATDLTVECWARRNSIGTRDLFYSQGSANTAGQSVYMGIALDGRFHIAFIDVAVDTDETFNDNEWHHYAATYDHTTLEVNLYVDGVLLKTATTTGDIAGNQTAKIGSASFLSGRWMDGALDELRIWGEVRTGAEIRANMYRTLEGDETGLLSYYRFDQQADAANTTLFDLTSNAHHGTLTNMDATTDWVASSPFNTWIGSEDGKWNDPPNWSRGVVPSTEDVGIYNWSGSSLPASTNITARDVYIDNGLTITHSGDLTLSGDVYNAGTFSTTGTATFSGSSAQAIRGTGTTTFGTTIVNNGNSLSLEKDLTTTDLTLTNGDFNIGANTLTLNGALSTASSNLNGGATSNLNVEGAGATLNLPSITLSDLTLNRANGLSLSGNLTLEGTLTLTDGLLDIGSSTLTIGNGGSISGADDDSYIATSGTGVLRRNVSSSALAFPIGKGSYTPLVLNNTGGVADDFSVRVDDVVYDEGSSGSIIDDDVVDRTWYISEGTVGGSNLSITFQWADSDEFDGFDRTTTQVKHYTGGNWVNVGSAGNPLGANPFFVQVTGISDFSPFVIADAAATLPVEWLDFKATALENQVRLDWSTAREQNSDYFAIERSVDQFAWQPLGEVAAAGYSETIQGYQFVDKAPVLGTAFYRLRQVDLDGAYGYSSVVEVSLEGMGISIYPNPVQDVLQLELSGAWEATLTDLRGKTINMYSGEGNSALSMRFLALGTYLLKVQSRSRVNAFLIQKE